jgi:hypothetical protein
MWKVNEQRFREWGNFRRKATPPTTNETRVILTGTVGKHSASRVDIAGDNGRAYSADPTALTSSVVWNDLQAGQRVEFVVGSETNTTVSSITRVLQTDIDKAYERWERRLLDNAELHRVNRVLDRIDDTLSTAALDARNADHR